MDDIININTIPWELVQLILKNLSLGNLILSTFVCKLWKSCIKTILSGYNKKDISYWVLALGDLILYKQWNLANYIIDDMLILNPKLVSSRFISKNNIKYLMGIVLSARNMGNYDVEKKLQQYGVFGSYKKLNNIDQLYTKWSINNYRKLLRNIRLLFVLEKYKLLSSLVTYDSNYLQHVNMKIFKICAYHSITSLITTIFNNCLKIYEHPETITNESKINDQHLQVISSEKQAKIRRDAINIISNMIKQLAKFNYKLAEFFIQKYKDSVLIKNSMIKDAYIKGYIKSGHKINANFINKIPQMTETNLINGNIIHAIVSNRLDLIKDWIENRKVHDKNSILPTLKSFNKNNLTNYWISRDMLRRAFTHTRYFNMMKYLYDNNIVTTKFLIKQSIWFDKPPDIVKYICNKENTTISELISKYINNTTYIAESSVMIGSYIVRHLRQRGKLSSEDGILYTKKLTKKIRKNKTRIKSYKSRNI